MSAIKKPKAIIRLPKPHDGGQEIFFNWDTVYPEAQCLVAPCGVKVGKSFGAALWLTKEALLSQNLFCVWIAPTYLKARIGYRYIKNMLPDCDHFDCVDGRLEIRLSNGSFIKFLHGRDAEVTVEGEAIDRFVIDEAGKTSKQVWFSLLTTITQTRGLGIITGTPRGFTWYYDVFEKAQTGDPFFCWAHLETERSPFIDPKALEIAKRLLPKFLYDQYYRALFLTQSSTFGDLSKMWDESLDPNNGTVKFWLHPDEQARAQYVCHGVDIAKRGDYTVFYSVNARGQMVGFCRFKMARYTEIGMRLKTYVTNYFKGENAIDYDATGVGVAFGDILSELDIDADITPVTFTNKSKSEMVTKTIMAIEAGWHKAPRFRIIEHEFSTYELTVLPSGAYRFSATDGEHDDIVSAAIMSISKSYSAMQSEGAEVVLSKFLGNGDDDLIAAYASLAALPDDDDDFFADDTADDDFDVDLSEM